MTPKQKTWAMVLSGIVVAVAPSFFGYLQAKDEIRARAKTSHAEAEAGYQTLTASVEELQQVVVQQHDYAVRLEGHIEALEAQVAALATEMGELRSAAPATPTRPTRRVGHGAGTGSGAGVSRPPRASVPRFNPEPPKVPNFKPLPADLDGAKAEADSLDP